MSMARKLAEHLSYGNVEVVEDGTGTPMEVLELNPSQCEQLLYELTGEWPVEAPPTHRVVSVPIVESESRPRRVLFEGSAEDAEAFWLDHIEREDVDPFYVEFGTIAETDGRWGARR